MIGESIGAGANVNRNAKICKIDDDTEMIHFLSGEEVGEDNDWLFIVIQHIVSRHIFMLTSAEVVYSFADIHYLGHLS